jgi:hypothetical protein
MSLRAGVRAFLAADGALMALLPGGLYPDPTLTPPDQTELTRQGMPGAFDEFGAVKVAALVVEDATGARTDHRDGADTYLRLFVWQQVGRDQIEAVQARVYVLLRQARPLIDGHYCNFRFAGFGPATTRDQSLGDAQLGWSRWQVTRVLA